jgi:crossover junction endodeoxyribonuclease RuvC
VIIFSIDPGVSGAICVFKDQNVLDIYDVPTMIEGKKNKRQINSAQVTYIFKSFINGDEKVSVIVEQVNAMPGQGVTSMFNFGQSFGIIKGICAALGFSIYFVRPAKWKKHFNLIGSVKDASRTKVIEIFPSLSPKITKKKDSNKADAILIGKYFIDNFKNNSFHG